MSLWTRLLTIAAVLASCTAHSSTNNWTSLGPDGGAVQKVIYNPATPDIVYLVSAGGFSRSTDGGHTWQMVYTDMPFGARDLAVDPSDPSRVYVVAPSPYLLMSSDAGKTVKTLTIPPVDLNGPATPQISKDGQTLFFTEKARLFASTDGGQTWNERTPISGDATAIVSKLLADPADPNTLYAPVTSQNGMWIAITHDGGHSWIQSGWSADPYSYTNDIAIDPQDVRTIWTARGNGVWVTHDGGGTWTVTGFSVSGVGASSLYATTIAIDPRNTAIIYAGGASGTVLRSSDGGTNWTDITGNNLVLDTRTIAVDPTTGAVLVGGLAGLWGLTPSSTAWSPQTVGLRASTVAQFSANPATDRIYLSPGENTVGFIANGASTVSLIDATVLQQLSPTRGTFSVGAILAQPGISGKVFASFTTGLASSTDGGASWSMQLLSLSGGTQLNKIVSWPSSAQTLLGINLTTKYRSMDGGNLWSPITDGVPASATFQTVATAPSDANVAYASVFGASSGGSLYTSLDGGKSWQPVGTEPVKAITDIVVDPMNARTLYVVTQGKVLKSTDGGQSYTNLPLDSQTVIAIDPVHPQIIYAAGVLVSRSIDGGATWQLLPPSPASPSNWNAVDIIVDPNRPNDVLVGTAAHGAFKLTVAPDLALDVQAPAAIVAGSSMTLTYTVANNGPFDTTGNRLAIQLPGGATGVSGSAEGGDCTTTSTNVICAVPALRAGATFKASLTAVAASSGMFEADASLTADQPDSDPTNNELMTKVQVDAQSAPAPPTPPTPPTSGGSAGGTQSGGGGSLSPAWLLVLAYLALAKCRRSIQSLSSSRPASLKPPAPALSV